MKAPRYMVVRIPISGGLYQNDLDIYHVIDTTVDPIRCIVATCQNRANAEQVIVDLIDDDNYHAELFAEDK